MPNDEIFEIKPAPNQTKQPQNNHDTAAVLVVVVLLIMIMVDSPNKTQKNNNIATDTATMIDTTAQKPLHDTMQIERYASPFDSMFYELFNPKHR